MGTPLHRGELERRLRSAGCVAAGEEAAELLATGRRAAALEDMVCRREAGEPLAWITGRTTFCGQELTVEPGLYVPRWQSENLARRAAARLSPGDRALDLFTGTGAVAAVLAAACPDASILAVDNDPRAVDCARRNGVDARLGELDGPVPADWSGTVAVITAVAPYVPTSELVRLPRDVVAYEPPAALDGGEDGLDWVRPTIRSAGGWLRPGGRLYLELGADQIESLLPELREAGLALLGPVVDGEGDWRGVEAESVTSR